MEERQQQRTAKRVSCKITSKRTHVENSLYNLLLFLLTLSRYFSLSCYFLIILHGSRIVRWKHEFSIEQMKNKENLYGKLRLLVKQSKSRGDECCCSLNNSICNGQITVYAFHINQCVCVCVLCAFCCTLFWKATFLIFFPVSSQLSVCICALKLCIQPAHMSNVCVFCVQVTLCCHFEYYRWQIPTKSPNLWAEIFELYRIRLYTAVKICCAHWNP